MFRVGGRRGTGREPGAALEARVRGLGRAQDVGLRVRTIIGSLVILEATPGFAPQATYRIELPEPVREPNPDPELEDLFSAMYPPVTHRLRLSIGADKALVPVPVFELGRVEYLEPRRSSTSCAGAGHTLRIQLTEPKLPVAQLTVFHWRVDLRFPGQEGWVSRDGMPMGRAVGEQRTWNVGATQCSPVASLGGRPSEVRVSLVRLDGERKSVVRRPIALARDPEWPPKRRR